MELRGWKCKEQGVYVEEEERWLERDSFKIKEFFYSFILLLPLSEQCT